ncbi:2Fe-2S iron-sulfur cluster-binding protein [Chamaesiphon sp. OTE_75_metabat_556]|jgi:ferredoxin|uniref:2Fe-2S iron-sulfur cluster-binding protein n=1 Tax=Chamaesiphon sp. OTE_75_metabat_556 TaxID=2964692 RepID=UPI00286B944D|nr:2Fe-2S iron-sulfur cluster-binding protein [Chamaesiphon sp. OTE_75_metabat_556]
MATVTLTIDGKRVEAEQNSTILSVFKEHDILVNQICGGQGMCASCHFFVVDGSAALTEQTKQEQMTLQFTKIDRPGARLACQTRAIGEGIVIELPNGTFVESEEDLERQIGKKADKTLIHPMTGEVLVQAGKLVLRSALEKMKEASSKFADYLSKN